MNISLSLTPDVLVTINTAHGVNIGIPITSDSQKIVSTPCSIHDSPNTNISNPHDITAFPQPQNTNTEKHLGAFHLPPATINPIEIGSWVGSIDKGANVNCNVITFCPHGCTTHTECVGHITSILPEYYRSVLFHAPTAFISGLLIDFKLTTYREFLGEINEFSHIFAQLLERGHFNLANESYKPDDIVLSLSSLYPAIVQLWESFTANIVQSATESSVFLEFAAEIQKFKESRQINLAKLFDIIPARFLSYIRIFSESLVIRTFLPQVYQTFAYHKQQHDQAQTNSHYIPNLIEIQEKYYENMDDLQQNSNFSTVVNFSSTNPPYIPVQLMTILCAFFAPNHIISDLPSLDKEDDGGKVSAHKTLFFYHLKKDGINKEKSIFDDFSCNIDSFCCENNIKRSNTELCWFPAPNIHNSNKIYELSPHPRIIIDLRTAAIDSDSTASTPIIYPVM